MKTKQGSLTPLHWRAIIFSVVSLVVLAIVAAYASNPALFAGLQSFAKNNKSAACQIDPRRGPINLAGCGSHVRDSYLNGTLKAPTNKKSAEKSCEESCSKIPSTDAQQSCLSSCSKHPFLPIPLVAPQNCSGKTGTMTVSRCTSKSV